MLQQSVWDIKQELKSRAQCITANEQWISDLEDELTQATILMHAADRCNQELSDKLEDLKNRSSRNNLRIMGLPESFKLQLPLDLCKSTILKALGIQGTCTAKCAHCIGPSQTDRQTPRPVLVVLG